MVVVPAGSFIMGAPANEIKQWFAFSEGPQHRVTIAEPLAVGRFEITGNQWDACRAHGGCETDFWHFLYSRLGQEPASGLSWHDARRYVGWLAKLTGKPYRLLTEAEWAGTQTAYSWGDEIGTGNANCDGCGSRWDNVRTVLPVGSFAPNAFGLHDMHGNVWEYVEDCFHYGYDGAPTDGSAWTEDGN